VSTTILSTLQQFKKNRF